MRTPFSVFRLNVTSNDFPFATTKTGLTVIEQVPIEVAPNEENRRYLAAKRDKLGHVLHLMG